MHHELGTDRLINEIDVGWIKRDYPKSTEIVSFDQWIIVSLASGLFFQRAKLFDSGRHTVDVNSKLVQQLLQGILDSSGQALNSRTSSQVLLPECV